MIRCIALTSFVLLLCPGAAYSDISMNIWDDGTNLYMSAIGNYDLTNASQIGNNFLGTNGAVAPTIPLFGWESGTATVYEATYSGVLIGTSDALIASSISTNNPFFFWNEVNGIVVSGALIGSVNEFATFNNFTVSSLGLVVGDSIGVSWGLGGINERGSITVGSVPEPGSLLIFGSILFVGTMRYRVSRVR